MQSDQSGKGLLLLLLCYTYHVQGRSRGSALGCMNSPLTTTGSQDKKSRNLWPAFFLTSLQNFWWRHWSWIIFQMWAAASYSAAPMVSRTTPGSPRHMWTLESTTSAIARTRKERLDRPRGSSRVNLAWVSIFYRCVKNIRDRLRDHVFKLFWHVCNCRTILVQCQWGTQFLTQDAARKLRSPERALLNIPLSQEGFTSSLTTSWSQTLSTANSTIHLRTEPSHCIMLMMHGCCRVQTSGQSRWITLNIYFWRTMYHIILIFVSEDKTEGMPTYRRRSARKWRAPTGDISMDTHGGTLEMTWKWQKWNAYPWLPLPPPPRLPAPRLPPLVQITQVTKAWKFWQRTKCHNDGMKWRTEDLGRSSSSCQIILWDPFSPTRRGQKFTELILNVFLLAGQCITTDGDGQSVMGCTDFHPSCALVDEARNSSGVCIIFVFITFFQYETPIQQTMADTICNLGLKDYCPVACNNCNLDGKKKMME